MARPSSGGFLFGFVAEIAIIVAVVSLLPRVDLSGGQTAADLPPRLVPQETSYYQRQPEPVSRPAAATPAPRITTQPLDTLISRPPQAAELREPPPLIVVDPARPAYVEQRLDRASQGLVNGLGDYLARTAERFRPPPASPVEATDAASGSFPTRQAPAPASVPRPWMRY